MDMLCPETDMNKRQIGESNGRHGSPLSSTLGCRFSVHVLESIALKAGRMREVTAAEEGIRLSSMSEVGS